MPNPNERLTKLNVPTDLHCRFKAACALRQRTMTDVLRAFIEEWTARCDSEGDVRAEGRKAA